MNIEQEKMIVEALSSLYPLQEFEEKAIDTVLNAIPHWIPVTERLPEYGEEVLTITKDNIYEVNHIIDEEYGEWFWEENGKIIAWMSLPAYKGVTE